MKGIMICLLLFYTASHVNAAEPFTFSSPQLQPGSVMPLEHTLNSFGCSGNNIPPALQWSNPPTGTQSFAVTVYDPDAPTGSGWWHWVILDIPADVRGIPLNSGASAKRELQTGAWPHGAVETRTDFGAPGYGGACPPEHDAPHHYIFTLYALDVPSLNLSPDSMPALAGFLIHAHTLGRADFMVTYGR